MNDQKLIELIRTGRSAVALNRLYHHFPATRKMVLVNGGSTSDAEDVFQEGLIILMRKVGEPDFELTAQLGTFLFAICRFVWKDEVKRRKRLVITDITSGVDQTLAEEIEIAIANEEYAKLAERVLKELKDRCRELLELFYYGHLKMQEIARKMGYASENAAKNQKYKCLETARNNLRELRQSTTGI